MGEVDQADEEVNLKSCLIAGRSASSYVTLICVLVPFIMTSDIITSRRDIQLDISIIISHHELLTIPFFSGAFIIPFLVMLLVVGMPLLLLELALGQKLRVGAARAWYKVTNQNLPPIILTRCIRPLVELVMVPQWSPA